MVSSLDAVERWRGARCLGLADDKQYFQYLFSVVIDTSPVLVTAYFGEVAGVAGFIQSTRIPEELHASFVPP